MGVGVMAEIVTGNGLLDGDRQYAFARKQRRVGILVNPPLFLGLLEEAVKVTKAQHHTLILVIAIVRVLTRVIIVASRAQLLY